MKYTLFKGHFPDVIEEVVMEFDAYDLYQAILTVKEAGYHADFHIRLSEEDGYDYVDIDNYSYFLRVKRD